jgi:hypothetical protein
MAKVQSDVPEGMLADGTNPEYVDPNPPLNWNNKDDLKDVVVWGGPGAIQGNRLCALLVYYKIPFKRMDKKKPKTAYKKIPIMDVAGRQVNDTAVIMKFLCPALGVELDQEWNIKIACTWDATFRLCADKVTAGRYAGAYVLPCSCLGCCMGGVVKNLLKGQGEKNAKNNEKYRAHPSGGLSEPAKEFKNEFKGKYHGGDEPDVVDLMLYGYILPAVEVQCPMFTTALSDAGLEDWYANMKGLVPVEAVFKGTQK